MRSGPFSSSWMGVVTLSVVLVWALPAVGQNQAKKPAEAKGKKKAAAAVAEPAFPPVLPGGKDVVTDTSPEFLKPPETVRDGVKIAKTPPTIDFQYFPGQTYPGKPWSNWGDSLAINGKYYAAIGDHLAPQGHAFVFEYDPATKKLRQLVDVTKLLNLPEGHYAPGKIHSRLDMGDDGWLYFSTHRGSTKVTTDVYHYKGDWIIRCHPESGKAEVVVQGPVPKHCIPTSVLDPQRLIFYGATAPGEGEDGAGIQFFAYDVKNHKLLYAGPDGPSRYMIFAKSTGWVYYTQGKDDAGQLMRFDPDHGARPEPIPGTIGIRAATQETPQGFVYTVSQGRRGDEASIFSFNTKTEEIKNLGLAPIGAQSYITSLDVDPTGRYIYYVPGAHGSAAVDGTPVIQFDVRTGRRKVLAFLHPFYQNKYGCTPVGTYSSAVDPAGDKLYVTWNVNRGGKAWDSCALSVIHIPESERSK